MILFTSDLHLGHKNILKLCNRPFSSIEEMDATLIENWNKKVHKNDQVYILGDLMYRNEKPPEEYLRQLNGKKHLITGNHDRAWVKMCDTSQYFKSVNRLDYISDRKRQMTLCHFPMMSWPHMPRSYMVFGHIHGTTDADYWLLIARNEKMLNAGVDINGYAPVTFDEMVENNAKHKAAYLEMTTQYTLEMRLEDILCDLERRIGLFEEACAADMAKCKEAIAEKEYEGFKSYLLGYLASNQARDAELQLLRTQYDALLSLTQNH